MTQQTLWDVIETAIVKATAKRITRKSHPSTSQEAADKLIQSGRLSGNAADAFNLVRRFPGRTGAELDEIAGCKVSRRISKRLGGLKSDGRVVNGPKRNCEVGCNVCVTWFVVGESNNG